MITPSRLALAGFLAAFALGANACSGQSATPAPEAEAPRSEAPAVAPTVEPAAATSYDSPLRADPGGSALAGAGLTCARQVQGALLTDPLARANAFLACTGAQEGVVTTPSGLQYEVLAMTNEDGASPSLRDFVCVQYRGALLDGFEFDSSYGRGEPALFPAGGLIQGWIEALGGMREGERRRLYIHPDLAYGARGAGGDIGPNEALVFDMSLLEVLEFPQGSC